MYQMAIAIRRRDERQSAERCGVKIDRLTGSVWEVRQDTFRQANFNSGASIELDAGRSSHGPSVNGRGISTYLCSHGISGLGSQANVGTWKSGKSQFTSGVCFEELHYLVLDMSSIYVLTILYDLSINLLWSGVRRPVRVLNGGCRTRQLEYDHNLYA